MKSILVLQHVAHEPLGILHALLRTAGFRIRYVNYSREPEAQVAMTRYDGLIVLGGPMGVYESARHPHLLREIALVRDAIADEKPVLGICLGAQIIAHALGAAVGPLPVREIGWYGVHLTEEGARDPMLSQLGADEPIFQWHGDGFALPHGAVQLAGSEACAQQAFRYGTSVYALQFHLEVDASMVDRWLDLPAHQAEVNETHGPSGRERIRAETSARIDASMASGRRVFGRWLELFSTKRRKTVLRSRA